MALIILCTLPFTNLLFYNKLESSGLISTLFSSFTLCNARLSKFGVLSLVKQDNDQTEVEIILKNATLVKQKDVCSYS